MLNGKVALVTGSVTGIGRTTARALAGMGSDIMLNGLGTAKEIEDTKSAISNDFGVSVKYHGADLAQRNEVEDLAKSTQDQFGRLDILINNAVIRYYKKIVDTDFIEPERVSAVIAFLCTDAAKDINGVSIPIDGGLANTWMQQGLE